MRNMDMEDLQISGNQPRICAGIVLYNPDVLRLAESIEVVLPQVQALILIDNTSANIQPVCERWAEIEKIVIIRNAHNLGIAKALNQICERAESNSFDWVLTLDQDSLCENNIIKKFTPYTTLKRVGIICPRIKYENIENNEKFKNEYEYIEACMTSASLTLTKAWRMAGGFDEWMFIDYVDNDFCMRLKLAGYRVLRVNTTVLSHQLGNSKEINLLFGIKVFVTNHSPFRNYYYVRNSIYFIRKYRKQINVWKYFMILIYVEIKKLVFEKNRVANVKSAIRGFTDGLEASL